VLRRWQVFNGLANEEAIMLHSKIKCLFVDIGGVLLNDGWSHGASKMAAKTFNLNLEELNKRHTEVLDTYEMGKLTLEEFLDRTVFYEKRSFTPAQFRKFMFAQSKPFPKMIELVRRLKTRYGLKIVVVSNEGRELNEYRIHKFKLDEFVDYFISSCFVHLRKPDAEIFRVALDTVRVTANQVVYIENTPMFVQVAEELGIRSILHTDYKSTSAKLASMDWR
jgi:putative hydrolase of the HAD superfamily